MKTFGPTEKKGFVKTQEGFLLNTDKGALQEYKAKKLKEMKLNKVETEISDLKNDMAEIKALLKGLVK